MSTQIITPAVADGAAAPVASRPTARLLTAGTVAGPLFLAVWALQAITRDGFDPDRHPISLLSLGDLGWIQITNFVVTGATASAAWAWRSSWWASCSACRRGTRAPGSGCRRWRRTVRLPARLPDDLLALGLRHRSEHHSQRDQRRAPNQHTKPHNRDQTKDDGLSLGRVFSSSGAGWR